jgi:hypothetical protein
MCCFPPTFLLSLDQYPMRGSLHPRLSENTMAGNSTTQVRGFARISAAAMDGFTQFIPVKASG